MGTNGATIWNALKIGAGGKLTSIDIAADGTKVVRNDTYGAYVWDASPGQWRQLVTLSTMPAADLTLGAGYGSGVNAAGSGDGGTLEIVIAPSNTQRFYMMFYGYIYRTDNAGFTWVRTGFARTLSGGGDPPAANGAVNSIKKFIAVDPANADVVYASTIFNELRVSTDAGATWATVPNVGNAGSNFGHVIAFDSSGGTQGSGATLRTKNVYVSTYGTGVYQSTNGGTSWTLTTGTPTTHISLVVAPNGTVWFIDNSGGNGSGLWKYTGTWSNIATFGGMLNLQAVAVDPANSSRVFVTDWLGDTSLSTNGGTSWSATADLPVTRTATDIPWLAWTNEGTPNAAFTTGNVQFDPSGSNKLYVSEGIGVWFGNPAGTTMSYTSQSAGIEQLVGNRVIVPPNGKPNFFFWDRAQFYSADPTAYPSTHGPNATAVAADPIIGGWNADYASSSPSTLVAIMQSNQSGNDYSGKSADGGQTWTDFASKTPSAGANYYGSIAASSATNFVWFPGQDASKPYYTTNGGTSWTPCTFPAGIPTAGGNGWNDVFVSNGNRRIVVADRVTAGKFYAYNNSAVNFGLYVSTDSGANWTQAFAGTLTGSSTSAEAGGVTLKSVPGQAGHLFYTNVQGSGTSFVRSTDGGVHWAAVDAAFAIIDAFGFGAVSPGQTYPSILAFGIRNGTQGFWQSIDNCATWTAITANFSSGDVITDIDGSKETPGLWYATLQGSGAVYGKLN